MVNIVLQILAALSCVLFAACADVMPQADFTPEGMAGKWYFAGVASNGEWLTDLRDDLTMGTNTLTITDAGNMDISFSMQFADGECWRMTYQAKKTETPGHFTFRSATWHNDDMRFVDVVYDNYAILHNVVGQDGTAAIINYLYSRTTEVSADVEEKFKQFCLSTGVLADKIVMLPTSGDCPGA